MKSLIFILFVILSLFSCEKNVQNTSTTGNSDIEFELEEGTEKKQGKCSINDINLGTEKCKIDKKK